MNKIIFKLFCILTDVLTFVTFEVVEAGVVVTGEVVDGAEVVVGGDVEGEAVVGAPGVGTATVGAGPNLAKPFEPIINDFYEFQFHSCFEGNEGVGTSFVHYCRVFGFFFTNKYCILMCQNRIHVCASSYRSIPRSRSCIQGSQKS